MHLEVLPVHRQNSETAIGSIIPAELRTEALGMDGAVTGQILDLILLGFFLLQQPDLALLIPAETLPEKVETRAAAQIAQPIHGPAPPIQRQACPGILQDSMTAEIAAIERTLRW